jgi:hypothetical protein
MRKRLINFKKLTKKNSLHAYLHEKSFILYYISHKRYINNILFLYDNLKNYDDCYNYIKGPICFISHSNLNKKLLFHKSLFVNGKEFKRGSLLYSTSWVQFNSLKKTIIYFVVLKLNGNNFLLMKELLLDVKQQILSLCVKRYKLIKIFISYSNFLRNTFHKAVDTPKISTALWDPINNMLSLVFYIDLKKKRESFLIMS